MTCKTNMRKKFRLNGFTLVELLAVIAVITILMTAGAIGINSLSAGKAVGSATSQAEALFNFARQSAVANNTRSRILIAKQMAGEGTNRHPDDLRRIVVALYNAEDDRWELTDRGDILPQNVYFSQNYSKTAEGSDIPSASSISGLPAAFSGEFFYYEFNSEGIVNVPAASFVIGSGVWSPGAARPSTSRAGERDFSGFVIWRNGRTSVFRSPTQIPNLPEAGNTNFPF